MWHFLNLNYQFFNEKQRRDLLNEIQEIKEFDEKGQLLNGASAFEQSRWLKAFKDQGEEELRLYRVAVSISKTEPEHPDFSSYMSSGFVHPSSPYSIEELSSLAIDDLVETLRTFKGGDGWKAPGIEGLAKAFEETVKAEPLKFYDHLLRFVTLEIAYIHPIISAYNDLWNDKQNLPWDDIWRELLRFISNVVEQERFWSDENAVPTHDFVANRHWVVSVISRLLQAGTKSDDHAMDASLHGEVATILQTILANEEGDEFSIDSDAVSIAINSPRGQCLEALINFALRECRLEDAANGGVHGAAWERVVGLFDDESIRSDEGEYEFVTLLVNYLPNFLYMSREWVLRNFSRIFDHGSRLKWACAVQGYAYVNVVDREIYEFLKRNGDFGRVFDDDHLKERVEEKFVQNVVIAFVTEFEPFEAKDSLLKLVLGGGISMSCGN